MKRIIITLFIAFVAIQLSAQEYRSAIGGKVGYGLIATYKTFLSESSAVDIFGGITWNGIAAGAYWLRHNPINGVENLSWYWGLGGSITTWDYGFVGYNTYYELGISGVLGLDYAFEDFPLNVSLDWAPTIVVADSYDYPGRTLDRFRGGYGALSIRYIINR